MKIVFVTTGLDLAGAETQIRDLSLALVGLGHVVTIVSLTKPKAFVEQLRAGDVEVHELGMNASEKTPLAMIKAIARLRQLIKTLRPDVVHAHMVHANLLSRIAAAFGGWPPLICTAHSTHEGGKAREWAYRLTNRFSSLDTTVSQAATDRYIAENVFRADKTVTVANGIDLSAFAPTNGNAPRTGEVFHWVAVGRLHEQKDYPNLLHALQRTGGCTLDIYGQGTLIEPLKALTANLQLDQRVRFMGASKAIGDVLPDYDGFVLSSMQEGFGLVVAEAMACGLPVVATRSGGPQEILGEDERAGFLVAPQDPDALAQAMTRMMALSPDARQAMGRAGRAKVVAEFGIASVAERWLKIYGQLAERKAVA